MMTRYIILLILYVVTSVLNGQELHRYNNNRSECEAYPFLIDSLITYNLDSINNEWVSNTVRHYESSEGKYDRIVFINPENRELIRAWNYYYDDSDNRYLEVSARWAGDQWIVNLKKESEFDSQNKKLNELRHYFKNNVWNFVSFSYYEYIDDKIDRIHLQTEDENGKLVDVSYSDYYYENDNLVEITNYSGDKLLLSDKDLYKYNPETGKLSERIIMNYLEDDNGSFSFYPFQRQLYYYDEYSLLREIVLQNFEGKEWKSYSKNIIFYKLDSSRKIAICHNNKTLCVSKNALKAHLDNGYHIGECVECSTDGFKHNEKNRYNKDIAVIYPNPAEEIVNIDLGDNDYNIKTIIVSDFYGRFIDRIKVKNQTIISIPRNGLVSGKYNVTMYGDQTYSSYIIFK